MAVPDGEKLIDQRYRDKVLYHDTVNLYTDIYSLLNECMFNTDFITEQWSTHILNQYKVDWQSVLIFAKLFVSQNYQPIFTLQILNILVKHITIVETVVLKNYVMHVHKRQKRNKKVRVISFDRAAFRYSSVQATFDI